MFQLMGRTDTNVIVNIDVDGTIGDPLSLIGTVVDARITQARKHSLGAKIMIEEVKKSHQEAFFAT
jgi:hypothetical protein